MSPLSSPPPVAMRPVTLPLPPLDLAAPAGRVRRPTAPMELEPVPHIEPESLVPAQVKPRTPSGPVRATAVDALRARARGLEDEVDALRRHLQSALRAGRPEAAERLIELGRVAPTALTRMVDAHRSTSGGAAEGEHAERLARLAARVDAARARLDVLRASLPPALLPD